jgi:alanine racemase
MVGDERCSQRAEAVVDLDAIAHNVAEIVNRVAPSAVWAVVKANAYGHGAEHVARRALASGAQGLCVALVSEGVALRQAGLTAPILVLSPHAPDEATAAVDASLTLTVHDVGQVRHLADCARGRGVEGVAVHVKVDTGMHRVGAAPHDAVAVVHAVIAETPVLVWDGVFSHLACADILEHDLTPHQIARFDDVLAEFDRVGLGRPRAHLANSAGALAWPDAAHDLVRVGIAVYGLEPGPGVAHRCGTLRAALTLRSRVSMVKTVATGLGVSYGWRTVLERDTVVATIPIGYADGVPRRWSTVGGEVLIGGRRRPILGVVTMDQLMVDCGDDPVAIGDEVVLLGRQGTEVIRAEDWAERLGTIPYEIVCGISARVPRRWVGDAQ